MILPEFLSFGKIDGLDALSTLGFAVSDGTDTFNAPNQTKQGYSYNWAGVSGTQFDLSSPVVFESRVFTLSGWIIGNSVADFEAKYLAFKTLICLPGARSFYVKKFNKTLYGKIKSFPNFAIPKGVYYNGSPCVAAEITIELDEVMIKKYDDSSLYFGYSDSGAITYNDIISGTPVSSESLTTYSMPFNTASYRFLWFAEISDLPIKTKYTDTDNPNNTGNIGGIQDLFKLPTIISGAKNFRVYLSNYKAIQLTPLKITV